MLREQSVPLMQRAPAGQVGLILATALIVVLVVAPAAWADGKVGEPAAVPASTARITAADPLNGGFLLVNNHGMLFHPELSDVQEDVAYARWLGSGIIRVFGTDNNGLLRWDGTRVGTRIAEIAPILRAAHVRLIVAFVNNHRAVPGELPSSAGWMDNYMQLLLPFYTTNWHGAYLQFVRDLVGAVNSRGARDVIYAWELGNELHTPRQPDALVPFITDAVQEVRALDPLTPILPGTMGANHVEPGNPNSSIARWLYCDAPVDGYTLHAYDWVSRQRPGDMPIDWDLDNVLSQPCPNGRNLPVIVEELGTSRGLPGVYTADDERARLQQEIRQIEFVRRFPQVVGFGVWNGESPRLIDRTFWDNRRGLTSYGPDARGGGSCYDPLPEAVPGARCQLEQTLRGLRFVRTDGSAQWAPGLDAETPNPLVGMIDPLAAQGSADALAVSGWVLDPSGGSVGVDSVDVYLGGTSGSGTRLAGAQLGLPRTDVPAVVDNPDWSTAGFAVTIPLSSVPFGATTLTLAAHTPERGTWLSSVQVVVPSLGSVPAALVVTPLAVPVVVPTVGPRIRAEIQAPQTGDTVGRSFAVQVLAPGADRVDVFIEPDRDGGGRLVGSAVMARDQMPGASFMATVAAPLGMHTFYVHVHAPAAAREEVLILPVTVS
jgi:hypothetical protein